MKKVTLYECEVCGTKYKVENECKLCEQHHRVGLQITNARYNAHDKGSVDGFPVKIIVSDGVKAAEYRR